MLDFFNWLSAHPEAVAGIVATVWTCVQEIRHQINKANEKKAG